jgi:putative FmdB family regulatory protein
MPIYTYCCSVCNTIFEDIVPVVDWDKPQTCKCGGQANRTYRDIPARMTSNWASWNTQSGKLDAIQKRNKGSVSDEIGQRHTEKPSQKLKDSVRRKTSRYLHGQ